METGYDVEPRPLGRSNRRRPWIVLGAAAIFLTAVVVKPWAGSSVNSAPAAVAETARPSASTRPVEAEIPPVPAAPRPTPIWPAASTRSAAADATALEAEGALGALAARSGTWGVGDAGVGPRMLRDEPWADWMRAEPEPVTDGPLRIASRPGQDLCAGFPTIADAPSLVAVTTPSDLVPDWRLAGWWTDGSQVESLAGSVRQVSPAGNRGISYLERTDHETWPFGRYEFHVIAGESTVSMSVCLTRRR